MSTRVLLVDDHAIVRDGLRSVLANAPGVCVEAEAGTAREGIRLLAETAYDLVILDLSLPDMSGLEAVKILRLQHPRLPIIIFSMHADREYCVRAFRAGAQAYVTKDERPDEIIAAVRAVLAGQRYVSRSVGAQLAGALFDAEETRPQDLLSDREFDVLRLIGTGKTVSEIARMLGLSVKTVSTYRARLLEKLDLRNTSQLIRYAIERGIAR